jgi:acetyl esterase/lipase
VRILIFILLFSISLFPNQNAPKVLKIVCFSELDIEKSEALCQLPISKQFKISDALPLGKRIATIQEHIRMEIDTNTKIVLVVEGFLGTLVSIAQTNMLPYYRNEIRGLILENSPVNLYQSCLQEQLKVDSENCHHVNNLYNSIGELASKGEIFKAVSPLLQMDWYWPKVILVGDKYQEGWIKGFSHNSIKYKKVKHIDVEETLKYFALIQSHKIQPKQSKIEPNFFGPLLRFHLNKILYQEKNKILIKENIAYGVDREKVYDVYYQDDSKDNPIIIYVHGGGWIKGDKSAYDGFSMYYADRRYTVFNINYRLMQHPKVGMDEMVNDVKLAIEHALDNAKEYKGNSKKVFVFAESAGGQLATVALSRINTKHKVLGTFFNSISTDLRLFPKEKQIRLSNIPEDKKRLEWLDRFSPINQLHNYDIPTLIAHSFDDKVVPSKHLEDFEILSILHHQNIKPIWVEGGVHPVAPQHRSLQPSYRDLENKLREFVTKCINLY